MKSANALTDRRTAHPLPSTSRRRCSCGCKRRATHSGAANGICMVIGCELHVRRWLRSPIEAVKASRRIAQTPQEDKA